MAASRARYRVSHKVNSERFKYFILVINTENENEDNWYAVRAFGFESKRDAEYVIARDWQHIAGEKYRATGVIFEPRYHAVRYPAAKFIAMIVPKKDIDAWLNDTKNLVNEFGCEIAITANTANCEGA